MVLSPKDSRVGKKRYILSCQGLFPRSESLRNHIQTTIFEDRLKQDRDAILKNGLDHVRGVESSCFLEDISNVSGGGEGGVRLRPDTEDPFNRADGLDEILLDCWMEF